MYSIIFATIASATFVHDSQQECGQLDTADCFGNCFDDNGTCKEDSVCSGNAGQCVTYGANPTIWCEYGTQCTDAATTAENCLLVESTDATVCEQFDGCTASTESGAVYCVEMTCDDYSSADCPADVCEVNDSGDCADAEIDPLDTTTEAQTDDETSVTASASSAVVGVAALITSLMF